MRKDLTRVEGPVAYDGDAPFTGDVVILRVVHGARDLGKLDL
jgi:hypothetical protein